MNATNWPYGRDRTQRERPRKPHDRRLLVVLMMMLIAIGSLLLLSAPTASAETRDRVDLTNACKNQYHRQTVYARHVDQKIAGVGYKQTPFGYYCAEWSDQANVSESPSYEFDEREVGDLDVQAYCSKYHAGSHAVGNYDTDRTWDCVSP